MFYLCDTPATIDTLYPVATNINILRLSMPAGVFRMWVQSLEFPMADTIALPCHNWNFYFVLCQERLSFFPPLLVVFIVSLRSNWAEKRISLVRNCYCVQNKENTSIHMLWGAQRWRQLSRWWHPNNHTKCIAWGRCVWVWMFLSRIDSETEIVTC